MKDHFVIECNDVWLVEYRAQDIDEFHALTWQPEIYQMLPGWNVPKEQRLDWLMNYEIPENKRFLQAAANGGEVGELRLRLGVILKETGELIGWCTTGIKEELPPPNREITYAISKNHRNKGYMTQAAKGMIQYLFENTDVRKLNAVALIHNTASNAVIQKCGFEYKAPVEIDAEAYNHYVLLKK
ncbi:GNAT family N-acetyltransferase [Neobacillus mesonae]|nr:GNAT family N-acetyltransferase [Neobacillus mesonae]